jgi:cytochrome c
VIDASPLRNGYCQWLLHKVELGRLRPQDFSMHRFDSLKGLFMKQMLLGGAIAFSLLAGPAMASEELLKKNACTACHAVDKKLVGPGYKEVAAKYKGQKDAAAKLADKVKKGGQGAWGPIPMPPNPNVSDADVNAMVKFILAL